jgi:hypothetical protein
MSTNKASSGTGGTWSEQEKVSGPHRTPPSRCKLTPFQVEFLVRLIYSNVATPKIDTSQLPEGRSFYAAQHLMRKLREQFNISVANSVTLDSPAKKTTTPRKRKAEESAKSPAAKKGKREAKYKSAEELDSDDEAEVKASAQDAMGQGGSGVKVENNSSLDGEDV